MAKRLSCFILALVISLTLMPVTTFAAAGDVNEFFTRYSVEKEGYVSTPPELRPGQVWVGKDVAVTNPGNDLCDLFTITLSAKGREYVDHDGATQNPVKDGTSVTVNDMLGVGFMLADLADVYAKGLSFNGDSGVVTWEAQADRIVGGASVSFNIRLKPGVGAGSYHTNAAPSAIFIPEEGNPAYWTKEIVEDFILVPGGQSWNNGNGSAINEITISDFELAERLGLSDPVVINFRNNQITTPPAYQKHTDPGAMWSTIRITINGVTNNYRLHLYWERNDQPPNIKANEGNGVTKTYIITIEGLEGPGTLNQYEIDFTSAGGNTGQESQKKIIYKNYVKIPGVGWKGNKVEISVNGSGKITVTENPTWAIHYIAVNGEAAEIFHKTTDTRYARPGEVLHFPAGGLALPEDLIPPGYRYDRHDHALTIQADSNKNIFKVYYIIDESQTLDYTVVYYYNGARDDSMTENLSVHVLEPVVSSVPLAGKDKNGKYDLAEVPYAPVLPTTITAQNNVITVYYVSVYVAPQQATVTVRYYLEQAYGTGDYGDEPAYTYTTEPRDVGTAVTAETRTYPNCTRNTALSGTTIIVTPVSENNVINVFYDLDEEPAPPSYPYNIVVEHIYRLNGTANEGSFTEDRTVDLGTADRVDLLYRLFHAQREYFVAGVRVERTPIVVPQATEIQLVEYTVKFYLDGSSEPLEYATLTGTVGKVVTAGDISLGGYRMLRIQGGSFTLTKNAESNVIKVYCEEIKSDSAVAAPEADSELEEDLDEKPSEELDKGTTEPITTEQKTTEPEATEIEAAGRKTETKIETAEIIDISAPGIMTADSVEFMLASPFSLEDAIMLLALIDMNEEPEEKLVFNLDVNASDGNPIIYSENYNYKITIEYNRSESINSGGLASPGITGLGGGIGGGGSSGNRFGIGNTVTIFNEPIPLADTPPLVTIVDDEVPLGRLPQTGGNGDEKKAIGLAGLLTFLGGLIGFTRKKKGK